MSALCQKQTFAPVCRDSSSDKQPARGLNHAFASQRIHFVTAVAKKPSEHLLGVFSELWRRGVGIKHSLAKVDGALYSLHVARACRRL